MKAPPVNPLSGLWRRLGSGLIAVSPPPRGTVRRRTFRDVINFALTFVLSCVVYPYANHSTPLLVSDTFLESVHNRDAQRAFADGRAALGRISAHVTALREQHNIVEMTQRGFEQGALNGVDRTATQPIVITEFVGFPADNVQTAIVMLVEQVVNEENRIREFLELFRIQEERRG